MKAFMSNPVQVETTTGTSLNSLVNQLMDEYRQLAYRSNSVISNEIEPGFFTAAPSYLIRPVLDEIFQSLLQAAHNGQISIFAEKFGDNITIEFEEHNNYNGYALAFRLCRVEPLARKAGGYLSVKGEKSLLARVSFCFPDIAGKSF